MSENIKLDHHSLLILQELQRDARQTVQQIAERVGLSTTPCWKRIKEMEAENARLQKHHEKTWSKLMGKHAVTLVRVEKLERLLREYETLYPEVGQLIAAIKMEWEPCNCWSEWDASVLARLSELQIKIMAAMGEESK